MIGVVPQLQAGIVLPESILASPWFGGFALFVGLNTVIYLGLTLAKFMPWPTPMHPDQVRAVLRIHDTEDHVMSRRLSEHHDRTADAREQLRASVARQTIPLALALTGIVAIISGLANAFFNLATLGPIVVFPAVYGLVLIVLAQIMARTRVSSAIMTWTWTILMTLLVVENSWRAAIQDSAVVLTYAVIALVVLAPIALSWRAGVIGALLSLTPIVLAGVDVTRVDTLSWAIAAVTAAGASFVLLGLRLAAVSREAVERVRAQTLESTDPLTGTFSRTGILALAPAVAVPQRGGRRGVSSRGHERHQRRLWVHLRSRRSHDDRSRLRGRPAARRPDRALGWRDVPRTTRRTGPRSRERAGEDRISPGHQWCGAGQAPRHRRRGLRDGPTRRDDT